MTPFYMYKYNMLMIDLYSVKFKIKQQCIQSIHRNQNDKVIRLWQSQGQGGTIKA